MGKLLRFPLQGARDGEGLRTLREELGLQGRFSGKGPEATLPGRAELRAEVQAFARVLRDLRFDAMRDAGTGKDGLQLAYEMLTSKSVGELEQKASDVHIEAEGWPPPTVSAEPETPRELERPRRESEPLVRSQVKKDLGESPNELDLRVEFERTHGSPETLRVQSWTTDAGKVVIQPHAGHLADPLVDGDDGAIRGQLTDKKLGPNMLWNLLHRFRGEGADSAVEQGHWDKLTFAAVALLALITLGVAALVAL